MKSPLASFKFLVLGSGFDFELANMCETNVLKKKNNSVWDTEGQTLYNNKIIFTFIKKKKISILNIPD